MHIPEPNQYPTPLKERLRYFLLVMLIFPPAATFMALVLGVFSSSFQIETFHQTHMVVIPYIELTTSFASRLGQKKSWRIVCVGMAGLTHR